MSERTAPVDFQRGAVGVRGHAAEEGPPIEGFVDACVVTADGRLIVVGWAHRRGGSVDIVVEHELDGGRPAPFDIVRGQRPDVAEHLRCEGDEPLGFVAVAPVPEGTAKATLRLQASGLERAFPLEPRRGRVADVLGSVSSFSDPERDLLNGALGLAPRSEPPAEPAPLLELPLDALGPFVRTQSEFAVAVEGRGVFVQGWLFDPECAVARLQVRCGGETSEDFLPSLVRFDRGDVAAAHPEHRDPRPHGFFAFVPMRVTGRENDFALAVTTHDGQVALRRDRLQLCGASPVDVLRPIVANFRPDGADAVKRLRDHVAPAVEGVWSLLRRAPVEERVRDYGARPEEPLYTVVVPLFGRSDFLLHQVTQFSRDPDFARAELVYVLDDPRIVDETVRLAEDVHRLFRMPFRLVELSRNTGYATANNVGVRHGSAERVVLLNSDVLPSQPGWLGRLAAAHGSLERAAVVAPRLLYYDDTIQHDGIAFAHGEALPGFWLNEHPGKGLPKWLAPEAHAAEVPAVTGACLMMSRALYDELGGLDEGYVLGDFEDSDLCLKARAAGYRCYVIRDEELYHLERQSFSTLGGGDWRMRLTLCNAWRHQRRWAADLERLASRRGGF